MAQSIGTLKKEAAEKDNDIKLMKSEAAQPKKISVDALEQHGRKDSIQIFGLPESTPGSTDEKVVALPSAIVECDYLPLFSWKKSQCRREWDLWSQPPTSNHRPHDLCLSSLWAEGLKGEAPRYPTAASSDGATGKGGWRGRPRRKRWWRSITCHLHRQWPHQAQGHTGFQRSMHRNLWDGQRVSSWRPLVWLGHLW